MFSEVHESDVFGRSVELKSKDGLVSPSRHHAAPDV